MPINRQAVFEVRSRAAVSQAIKEIVVRLNPDPKIASRKANGASTSRLPWDCVAYTSREDLAVIR
jgi:hypothetical protein